MALTLQEERRQKVGRYDEPRVGDEMVDRAGMHIWDGTGWRFAGYDLDDDESDSVEERPN